MIQQLFGSLIEEAKEVADSYVSDVEYSLEVYLRHLVYSLTRMIAVSAAGALIAAAGAVFLAVSLVELLDLFLPQWAALGLVGVLVLGCGGGMLLLARRMSRETRRQFRRALAVER